MSAQYKSCHANHKKSYNNCTHILLIIKHTCTFEEFEPAFLGKPLSIPKSAKKLDDFGGTTWPIICGPLEPFSADWTLSTYSKRLARDKPAVGELFVEETGITGSSGFWS